MKSLKHAALALWACAAIWTNNAAAQTRIVIGGGADVVGMNALDVNITVPDRSLMDHISDTLLQWDEPGKLGPWLATSVKNIDPVTWEVKLRNDVKFQNGEPFNAAAVKFTFETILAPDTKAVARPNYTFVDRVEIVDEFTARLITKDPLPVVPNILASVHMIPPEYVKKVGVDAYRKQPVGTGPYRFVEHVRDTQITLEANPTYWGGAQDIKTIVYRPIKEAQARVSALVTGEIDLALQVPPELSAWVQGVPTAKIKTVLSQRSFVLLLSNVDPSFPTNNRLVREAINYAIDRKALNDGILGGVGAPTAWFNPKTFSADPSLQPLPYDPERAKKLLAEAGYPNGIDIAFDAPNGQYLKDREIAEAIVGHAAKAGIRFKLQTYEWAVFTKRGFSHQTNPALLMGWGDVMSDPHSHNRLMIGSQGSWSQTRDSELDKLIRRAETEMNPDARKAILQDIQNYERRESTAIYMVQIGDVYGASSKLDKWQPRSDEKVWMFRNTAKR